jgi:hypothetical protein
MVGSFNTLNGLATLSNLEVSTMVRKSVAPAAAKSYSLDALETHFRAVEGRFEANTRKRNATHNLILAYVLKLNDGDTAREAFVKRFGLSDKSVGSRISHVRRNVAAFDALGWIDLPTGNKDLTMADTDKVAGIVAAFRAGDVEQIAPAVKLALDEGLPMTDALKEGARVGAKTKGTTGKGRKGGAKPGAKTNTPETANKAAGGTQRDNSTDAKSDDRSAYTRIVEHIAAVTALLNSDGENMTVEEAAAVREALALALESVPTVETSVKVAA